ncbi:phosphodiesterase mj0936/vps29 [Lucifera butyrica]|uniref:Phosphoesterase n=1 Tax=Lucifera butyrica TaxID=1351585 RepID=A0A498R8K9_9FIRM|nr:metallophosphoesterase [Lucifera butyrica]VBB06513.1 phosphodiesterase mj0936/vps29 [Lucifera butyrica]
MKIGVISDTHGSKAAVKLAVAAAGPVAMWLHAGDYYWDSYYLAEITALPVHMVAGNCDGSGDRAQVDAFIEAGNKKIWLTHGHRYGVKHGVQDLLYWGKQFEADVVIYGHTHMPQIAWQNGLLIFNPGSAAEPRGGSFPTCGLLELLPDGKIRPELLDLIDPHR